MSENDQRENDAIRVAGKMMLNAKLAKRPVAWRVKDFADGWIIFQNENDANIYATSVGAQIQGLYVRDGT
jgi:hypothetical protein